MSAVGVKDHPCAWITTSWNERCITSFVWAEQVPSRRSLFLLHWTHTIHDHCNPASFNRPWPGMVRGAAADALDESFLADDSAPQLPPTAEGEDAISHHSAVGSRPSLLHGLIRSRRRPAPTLPESVTRQKSLCCRCCSAPGRDRQCRLGRNRLYQHRAVVRRSPFVTP
jgi:hypothetical protein